MKRFVEDQIERLRAEMVRLARMKGLAAPEVMAISREIDRLHNLWNLLTYPAEKEGIKPKEADLSPHSSRRLSRDFPLRSLHWRGLANQYI